jgi:hypothetical protein
MEKGEKLLLAQREQRSPILLDIQSGRADRDRIEIQFMQQGIESKGVSQKDRPMGVLKSCSTRKCLPILQPDWWPTGRHPEIRFPRPAA